MRQASEEAEDQNGHKAIIPYPLSSYLSVSTRVVIGQFCGPYFTVRAAKIESCSFPARPINPRDIVNILLTSFSRSVQ